MLRATNLQRPGLAPFDLNVKAGTCLAIMGPSGVGKSLLLRALADLDPSTGDVFLGDIERSSISAPAWRQRVVYVPAESGWWTDFVGDAFADRQAAQALLADIGLPEEAMDWPVTRLSTGERQRLALLRALTLPRGTIRERLYLLDEPTSGLDADTTKQVEHLLLATKAPDTALIVVTHDAGQAARLGDTQLRLTTNGFLPEETEATS